MHNTNPLDAPTESAIMKTIELSDEDAAILLQLIADKKEHELIKELRINFRQQWAGDAKRCPHGVRMHRVCEICGI